MSLVGDFDAASKLVGVEYGSLELVDHKTHIALPSAYLGKVKEAVSLLLGGELQQYSTTLNGLPVAYNSKRVKLVSPVASIVAAQSCVHFDVVAQFVVFRPHVGDLLKGKVNQRDIDSVSCLIHGFFYAYIHFSESDLNKLSSLPKVGDVIFFKVSRLDEDGEGYLSIIGEYERAEGGSDMRGDVDSGIDDDQDTSCNKLESKGEKEQWSSPVPSGGDNVDAAVEEKRKKKKKKDKKEKKRSKDKKSKKKNPGDSLVVPRIKSRDVSEMETPVEKPKNVKRKKPKNETESEKKKNSQNDAKTELTDSCAVTDEHDNVDITANVQSSAEIEKDSKQSVNVKKEKKSKKKKEKLKVNKVDLEIAKSKSEEDVTATSVKDVDVVVDTSSAEATKQEEVPQSDELSVETGKKKKKDKKHKESKDVKLSKKEKKKLKKEKKKKRKEQKKEEASVESSDNLVLNKIEDITLNQSEKSSLLASPTLHSEPPISSDSNNSKNDSKKVKSKRKSKKDKNLDSNKENSSVLNGHLESEASATEAVAVETSLPRFSSLVESLNKPATPSKKKKRKLNDTAAAALPDHHTPKKRKTKHIDASSATDVPHNGAEESDLLNENSINSKSLSIKPKKKKKDKKEAANSTL